MIPDRNLNWHGSLTFLDSAFLFADFPDSIFAVFSFLLLGTQIISKPAQGYISLSETDSMSQCPPWGGAGSLAKAGTRGTTPNGI